MGYCRTVLIVIASCDPAFGENTTCGSGLEHYGRVLNRELMYGYFSKKTDAGYSCANVIVKNPHGMHKSNSREKHN